MILQYFRPSFRYHLSLRSFFCLFLSGRLRQVLLYLKVTVSDKYQENDACILTNNFSKFNAYIGNTEIAFSNFDPPEFKLLYFF